MKNSRIRLPLNHENCILLPPRALLGLWPLQPLQAVICLALTADGTGSRAGGCQPLWKGKRRTRALVTTHRIKIQAMLKYIF